MQCFKRWKSFPHRVDSSEFDLCSRWRPCKGSSQLPAGRVMMIMKIILILIDSKRTKNSLVKNTSEYSEHKWMKTGTSPLGSLQQVWSSLHENDGSWGHLWLPLGKNDDSLFFHLYFKLVAASGQKRISLANLWSPLARGKDTCNVHSLFSAWNTCVLFLSIYSAHKQGKKEERAKESHFLLIFEESKSVRRYVGHWSDPQLETKTKLNPLNRNLFQWVLEILTNTSSICICTVSNTDWFSVLFW